MIKTVAMVVDSVKARQAGLSTHVRKELHTVTIFVDQVFEGRSTMVGRVTVYESGRWQEFGYGDSGTKLMDVSPDLEALRFRRAA